MLYTLRHGYDKQIKKRVEKSALYGVPLAILAVVGIASLTNNITHITNQPILQGAQSGSSKQTKDPSVAKSWSNTASTQKTASSTDTGMTSGAKTNAQSSPTSTVQKTATGGTASNLTPITGGKGGGETTTPTSSPLPVTTSPAPPATDPVTDTTSGTTKPTSPPITTTVTTDPLSVGADVGGIDPVITVPSL